MNVISRAVGWTIGVWCNWGPHLLSKGDRIMTPHGMGTVTGGAINVRLDTPRRCQSNGSMNVGHTYNLDTIARD